MAGLFDDLIPEDQGATPRPRTAAARQPRAKVAFDDLVPAAKPKGRPAKPKPSVSPMTGFMANVNRGLAIGDELAAAGGVVTGLMTGRHKLTDPVIPAFKAELAAQRGREDTFAEEHPNLAALGRGSGSALTMAAPVGPGAQAFATGGKMINAARGATLAGTTAAGYAALDRGTVAERMGAAADAARDPVTLAIGAGVGAAAAPRKTPRRPVPTRDAIAAEKSASYKAVDESGVTFTPEAFRQLSQNIADDLGKVKLNPTRHPKASSMLDDISAMAAEGEPISLTGVDQLRQVVSRDVANATDDAERMMGKRIINQIDAWLDAAGPAQLNAGDAAAAVDDLTRARSLNTRVRKLDALDEEVLDARRRAAASGSGGNIDNTTRQAVRRFMTETSNLTPDEMAAAEQAVMGSGGQNMARQIGKLSPQGNGLMTALSIGGTMANPALGVPVLAGAVSKTVADAITSRNVRQLRELIASGGRAAAEVSEALADPAYAELRRQLANDLAVQAGVQTAAARGTSRAFAEPR